MAGLQGGRAPVDRALLSAIVAIHRSNTRDSLRAAFVEHVPAALEAEAYGIYLLHPRLESFNHFIGRAPTDFLAEYEAQLRPHDPIFQFVTRERSVMDGATLLGRRWRLHPMRAWLGGWGLQHSMQGAVVLDGEFAGTVNFARGSAGGSFTARSRSLARVICDEVGTALGRIIEREAAAQQLALAQACFDNMPVPAVVTDAQGRIQQINERARHCGGPDCTRRCVRALRGGAAPACAPGASDGGEIAQHLPLPGFEQLFLSSWHCCTGAGGDPLDVLPPRSREVARLLLEGQQIKSIAWELGIAQDTVKDHIKRIYRRLGVSSRTQLLRIATARGH